MDCATAAALMRELGELVAQFAVHQGRRTTTVDGGTLTVSVSDFGFSRVEFRGVREGLLAVGDDFGHFTVFGLRRVGGLWRSAGTTDGLQRAVTLMRNAVGQQQEAVT